MNWPALKEKLDLYEKLMRLDKPIGILLLLWPTLWWLAVLLVVYRAVAYRRKREDLQLIVLGLFLIVVAGVLTVALEFAVLAGAALVYFVYPKRAREHALIAEYQAQDRAG